MAWIPKRQFIEATKTAFPELELADKTIENWAMDGRECQVIRQGRRIGFEGESIQRWHERIRQSIVTLDDEDYLRCFRFGAHAYYSLTRSDFNRTKQRDGGEFLTNQTRGKLGEIAVEKLLERHGVSI